MCLYTYMCMCTHIHTHMWTHSHISMHTHTHGHAGQQAESLGRVADNILLGSLIGLKYLVSGTPTPPSFQHVIEKSFIHQTIHPFKVYNSMGFNLFTELDNQHHN